MTVPLLLFVMTTLMFVGCCFWAAVLMSLEDGCCDDAANSFENNFNFVFQTWTTIGYGTQSPTSPSAHFIVVLISVSGIIWVTITSGLVFTSFMRSPIKLEFAHQVTISNDEKGIPTLMARVSNLRGIYSEAKDVKLKLYIR
eukprot:CAMPEP_0175108222 /NCGR_PEP_ID=MMETSP0086_2-20121207/12491_1 /TAXON_ID=136419 /ORGANISM="Unknown Unknown, Strain D1" /LENGTH=141 /DNA_ID=CAMNT_0016385357 /DNA_START=285 /DNA_END=706 /DNA_ORIENTATION=+